MTEQVIIGMDPHKSSNTIAVLTRDETMLTRRRFAHSDDGFVEMLDGFAEVIPRRHEAMLQFLVEPRSLDEMASHRFIYRPGVEMTIVDAVERRSADLHVQRMLRRGEAIEVAPGRFRRI